MRVKALIYWLMLHKVQIPEVETWYLNRYTLKSGKGHRLCLLATFHPCLHIFPWSFSSKSRYWGGVPGTSRSAPPSPCLVLTCEVSGPNSLARGIILWPCSCLFEAYINNWWDMLKEWETGALFKHLSQSCWCSSEEVFVSLSDMRVQISCCGFCIATWRMREK